MQHYLIQHLSSDLPAASAFNSASVGVPSVRRNSATISSIVSVTPAARTSLGSSIPSISYWRDTEIHFTSVRRRARILSACDPGNVDDILPRNAPVTNGLPLA